MIVYDTGRLPVYQRFGDTAVVPPEGVIAVISVKKHLYRQQLEQEFRSLKEAAGLCAQKDRKGPFLGLVSVQDRISGEKNTDFIKSFEAVLEAIHASCDKEGVSYEELPGYVGALRDWSVHKTHRKDLKQADYLLYVHKNGEEHLGVQFLLKGILDVYYSGSRGNGKEPGMFSFPKGRQFDGERKSISYQKVRAGRFG